MKSYERIISVEPLPDYRLLLVFADKPEVKRVYDVKPLLKYEVFKDLKNEAFFKTAFIEGASIAWNDDIDICPENLYMDSVPYEE